MPAMGENQVQFVGQRKSLGGGHGNPLQQSCLENPMDRGAWGATVYGATETALSVHAHTRVVNVFRPHALTT